MEATALVLPQPSAPAPSAETRNAGRTLGAVALVGLAVSLLTWRVADVGLGWLVADAVMIGGILGGVARRRPRAIEALLAIASLWLAGATAWYASDWALVIAFPGSLLTLGLLALVATRRIGMKSLADVGSASFDALRSVPGGIADAARTPVRAVSTTGRTHLVGLLRGALVGIPLAGFFALLLSADAGFRHAVGRMVDRSGAGLELGVWTLATTLGLLVAQSILARVATPRERRPSLPYAFVPIPYRTEGDAPSAVVAAPPTGPRIRELTWGVVLAHLVAVFGVYVAANAPSLFAGHEHLRAHGTRTYAEYVHEGFAQVSVATLLAVTCVVVGHILLRARAGDRRVTGGKALVSMELALLALVGVTLASSAHRLGLYEEAYGYTYLRLGVWVLQLGAAGLLVMTAARCVARGWTGWGTALAWSGVAFAVLSGSLNADRWIAERNVERARTGALLDVDYLAELSEDARVVLPQLQATNEEAYAEVARAWHASSVAHRSHGWRSLRGLGAR
jgi:hypothetical protein